MQPLQNNPFLFIVLFIAGLVVACYALGYI